jgi:hypothetical protein
VLDEDPRTDARPCPNNTPPWFTGHWRDWHRGHGCEKDDGKPRSEAATAEIARHATNGNARYLTDAEPGLLHARSTAGDGDASLVRAPDELETRWVPLSAEDRGALTRLRAQLAWRTIDVEAAHDAYIPVLDRLLSRGAPR